MSSYRTELRIPINKDNRTFQQRQYDRMEKLESSNPSSELPHTHDVPASSHCSPPPTQSNPPTTITSTSSNYRPASSSRITSTTATSELDRDFDDFFNRPTRSLLSRGFGLDDYWNNRDDDVSNWMRESRRKWDDDIENMKRSMFNFESDRDWFDIRDSRPSFIKPSYQKRTTLSSHPPQIPNNYEYNEDGELVFKVRFNAPQFQPENIQVTCTGNTINLTAYNDVSKEQFQKSIQVPDNVNTKNIQCHMTQDGVLILEAPVNTPEYSKIVPITKTYPETTLNQSNWSSDISQRNSNGPMIVLENGRKKLHLEIPVEDDYLPSDFTLKTEPSHISIHGRHEVKTVSSSSFKEFSRSFQIPELIDPMTVTYNIYNGRLIIEAMVY